MSTGRSSRGRGSKSREVMRKGSGYVVATGSTQYGYQTFDDVMATGSREMRRFAKRQKQRNGK